MDSAALETVLAQVHQDMDGLQSAIAECNRRRQELETEYAKLKGIEAYLTNLSGAASTAIAAPVAARAVILPGIAAIKSVAAEGICQKATELLRAGGDGSFVRAIDVALALVPTYERASDKRNFENRIYAVLKRRPNEFVRRGKGKWTLKKHGLLVSMTDDDEFEELEEELSEAG